MMKRAVTILGCLVGLFGCSSSSSGGGNGFGGDGTCADFSGTYEGQWSCSDGSSESRTSSVTQNGCSVSVTNLDTGETNSWQASGNKIGRNMNEDGVTGRCEVTLNGNSYTQSCTLSAEGQKITCTGSGSRLGGGETGSGGYGSGGSSGGGYGGEPSSGGSTGGDYCGATWTNDSATCEQCMQSSCCSALAGCAAGTACGALLECAASYCGSGGAECIQTYCYEELQAGMPALQNLVDCNTYQCGECG